MLSSIHPPLIILRPCDEFLSRDRTIFRRLQTTEGLVVPPLLSGAFSRCGLRGGSKTLHFILLGGLVWFGWSGGVSALLLSGLSFQFPSPYLLFCLCLIFIGR